MVIYVLINSLSLPLAGAGAVRGDAQARLWLHGRRGAPCDRLLEDDVDAAARGVFERLYGLVAKAILLETVKRGTERVIP